MNLILAVGCEALWEPNFVDKKNPQMIKSF